MSAIEDTFSPHQAALDRNRPVLRNMLRDLISSADIQADHTWYGKMSKVMSRKYKLVPNKRELGIVYREMVKAGIVQPHTVLHRLLIKNAVRSDSGILNISVSLPPDKFSCKYNCHFCPNQPGMPRSYLSNEDVFMRAASVDFDTVRQVYSRLDTLEENGHPIDKIEFRVLGGTFSCYDHAITDTFVRDLYYAANTYFGDRTRPRGTIEEEQGANVTAQAHVVGLGVETRPDEITPAEVIRFRRYGVTRVELGVQHTDDNLLRKVNRGHLVKHSKAAIKLLKDYGFKLEIHIMADLPGATPEGDKDCYRQVLRDDPDLIPDYMKDYPCLDVDYTKIKEWKASGKWTPYAERTPDAAELKDVLVYRQSITPKWVRVNRMQRDFKTADESTLGYTSAGIRTNLAQLVAQEAEAQGIYCKCIRCCEIRDIVFDPKDIQYNIAMFPASGGTEYFLSAELPGIHRHVLLGFLRLRVSSALKDSIIPELCGATAMIRELHVYGRVQSVGTATAAGSAQHMGIGKQLLEIAECIAYKDHKCTQMAVISGIGVRDYYRKRGYELRGTYMMKTFKTPSDTVFMPVYCVLLIALVVAFYFKYI